MEDQFCDRSYNDSRLPCAVAVLSFFLSRLKKKSEEVKIQAGWPLLYTVFRQCPIWSQNIAQWQMLWQMCWHETDQELTFQN